MHMSTHLEFLFCFKNILFFYLCVYIYIFIYLFIIVIIIIIIIIIITIIIITIIVVVLLKYFLAYGIQIDLAQVLNLQGPLLITYNNNKGVVVAINEQWID